MKIQKIIYLLIIIAYDLISIKAMKITKTNNEYSITLQSIPEDIIIKILNLASNHPLTSQVCKSFQQANKKNIKKKWNQLNNIYDKYFSSIEIDKINILENPKASYTWFNQLYNILARKLNIPTTKPKDPTDIKVYIDMLKQIQQYQDDILVWIWPRIYDAIIHQATQYSAHANTKYPTTAQQIRQYLQHPENKKTIEQVTYLNLSGCRLSYLPIELSIFTNLQILDLRYNRLSNIKIPKEFALLQILYLGNNILKSIEIPSNLNNLLFFDAQFNRLKSINIPSQLTNLRTCLLNNNLLTSINVPHTLINLRRLLLQNNHLKTIKIPRTLVALKELGIYGNKLSLDDILIPDSLKYKIKFLTRSGITQSLYHEYESCTLS